jgi:hypothetical protein
MKSMKTSMPVNDGAGILDIDGLTFDWPSRDL